jgi:hypothetical protein
MASIDSAIVPTPPKARDELREIMIMLTEENDAAARLKREVALYLKGEAPSPPALEHAPLLENWRTSVMQVNRAGDPLHLIPVLVGNVTGHPRRQQDDLDLPADLARPPPAVGTHLESGLPAGQAGR